MTLDEMTPSRGRVDILIRPGHERVRLLYWTRMRDSVDLQEKPCQAGDGECLSQRSIVWSSMNTTYAFDLYNISYRRNLERRISAQIPKRNMLGRPEGRTIRTAMTPTYSPRMRDPSLHPLPSPRLTGVPQPDPAPRSENTTYR